MRNTILRSFNVTGTQELEALSNTLDVVEKIDVELEKASEKLNGYVAKEEAGQTLSSKEASYKRFYEQTIAAFEKISASVDSELGGRANCENLIPLYAKDFEANAQFLTKGIFNLLGE